MSAPVRLALVGPGDVAHRDYLPELGRLEGRAELAAVCGRGEARARATGERFGAPWFTDVARMLDEVDVDAVVNLTPIPRHEEITSLALEAGRHVYSEKPLASSIEGATRIAEEADRRGLVVVAAPSVMLFPQVILARRLLTAGIIGEVRTVRGVTLGGVPPWLGYTSDPTPFFARGAGPLVDLGVYALHVLTGILGPVRGVRAMSSRSRDHLLVMDGPAAGRRIPIEADDAWLLLLDLGEGRLGSLEANFTAHGTRAAELELMGTEGTLAMSLLDVSRPVEVMGTDGRWMNHPVESARSGGPDHILGVEHLVELVSGRETPVLTPRHAIHVLEVIRAAEEASRAGDTRRVSSRIDSDHGSTVTPRRPTNEEHHD